MKPMTAKEFADKWAEENPRVEEATRVLYMIDKLDVKRALEDDAKRVMRSLDLYSDKQKEVMK